MSELELVRKDGSRESVQSSDGHVPRDRWEFDQSVTDVFDDMLSRSIPQYEVMRRAVVDIASPFVRPSLGIVDLGASRGGAIEPFVNRFGAGNRFVCVEKSKPMAEALREHFAGWISNKLLTVEEEDLRSWYPDICASVTLLVLTLQFTPINYRQEILRKAFERTADDGCVILVEKVLGSGARLDDLMVAQYHRQKQANGYTAEEIERKRLALEGVLVPVTAKWNAEMLREAGFAHVDCFWRWMNFAGWIAVK